MSHAGATGFFISHPPSRRSLAGSQEGMANVKHNVEGVVEWSFVKLAGWLIIFLRCCEL